MADADTLSRQGRTSVVRMLPPVARAFWAAEALGFADMQRADRETGQPEPGSLAPFPARWFKTGTVSRLGTRGSRLTVSH